MFSGRVSLFAATLIASLAVPVTAGPAPFFMSFRDLPGGFDGISATAVSADGSTVVGGSYSASGLEAFRWTKATGIVGLGDLPGGSFQSGARGVSGDGRVVVGYGTDVAGGRALAWNDGIMVPLTGPDGWTMRSAGAVSVDGRVIVGSANTGARNVAYRWEDGVVTALTLTGDYSSASPVGVSSDGRVVVGNAIGIPAWRWEDGVTELLPGIVRAVSPDGAVCVGDIIQRASLWQNGVTVDLGYLPGGKPQSYAYGVSDFGRVVVGTSTGRGAFIWDAQNGMRRLQDVLAIDCGLNLGGWYLDEATAITPDGLTIAGNGRDPNGYSAAWIVRIPEPASLALLALGSPVLIRRRVRTPAL